MVKMSLDPVQVMSGQVKELKVAPSANGDSRGSWEGKEEFDQDHLGLTAKPKPVSPAHLSYMSCVCLSSRLLMDHPEFIDSFTFTGRKTQDLLSSGPLLLSLVVGGRCLYRTRATLSVHQRGWEVRQGVRQGERVSECQAPQSLVSNSYHDLLSGY